MGAIALQAHTHKVNKLLLQQVGQSYCNKALNANSKCEYNIHISAIAFSVWQIQDGMDVICVEWIKDWSLQSLSIFDFRSNYRCSLTLLIADFHGDFLVLNPSIPSLADITQGKVNGVSPLERFGASAAFAGSFMYIFGGSPSPGQENLIFCSYEFDIKICTRRISQ